MTVRMRNALGVFRPSVARRTHGPVLPGMSTVNYVLRSNVALP